MVTDEMRSRFETALRESSPVTALRTLSNALKSEGVSQVTIYRLFEEFQSTTDGDDPKYDAIVDNMDRIWGGPWAKGDALFDRELKDTDINP